jgi:hypothetical protein
MSTISASFVSSNLATAKALASQNGYNYIVNYIEKGAEDQSIVDDIELCLALISSIEIYGTTFNGSDVVNGDTCISSSQIANILNKIFALCGDAGQPYIIFE